MDSPADFTKWNCCILQWGGPVTAKWITQALPESHSRPIGEAALSSIERRLAPSELPAATVSHLKNVFSLYTPENTRVIFRSGKTLGANVFSFPDGTIIFTDQLVKLAESEQELIAMLAHELGHLHYQHGMQTLNRKLSS